MKRKVQKHFLTSMCSWFLGYEIVFLTPMLFPNAVGPNGTRRNTE
jgi:hypothetical protein